MSELTDHLAEIGYEQIHPDQAVPDGFVAGLEAALGCSLPADYLDFLTVYPRSGSCYLETCVPLLDAEGAKTGGEACWSNLHGYDAKASQGLVGLNLGHRDHAVEDAIIIGADAAGNMFYMGVNDPQDSAVYFKNRGISERMTLAEMTFVRPSFKAFILDSYTLPDEVYD